jgi:hypothetical protein
MPKSFFQGNPPSSNPKSGSTKVPTAASPAVDSRIPSQDPRTWPNGGRAPIGAVPPGPGTTGAPLAKPAKRSTR